MTDDRWEREARQQRMRAEKAEAALAASTTDEGPQENLWIAADAALTDFIAEKGSDFDEGEYPGFAYLRYTLGQGPEVARPAEPGTLDVERLAKAIHDDRCVDPRKHSEEAHAGKDPDTQEEAARILRYVNAALRSKEPTDDR